MGDHSDLKLARRVAAGDERAFDRFFSTYYPRLFRFALVRLGGDESTADDTAQTVLCQALSKLSTYRGEAALFSWLCTFCRHELARQRKALRRAQGDAPLSEDDPAVRAALESLLASDDGEPELAQQRLELKRLVQVALDHLPGAYADALEWKYVHGRSVHEIATTIGLSDKAAESLLTRARVAFRDCIAVLLDGEAPAATRAAH